MPIDWLTLGAAMLTGLMGGVHCAAMCGGIATGFSAMGPRAGWKYAVEPNLGRVLGYVLAGAAVGLLGRAMVDVVRIDGLALAARAAVGAVLIVIGLRMLDRGGRLAALGKPAAAVWSLLRPLQQPLLPADKSHKRIALGMLWGWMPCGLSTTLLLAAWLQGDAARGAMTMGAFGLGTLPIMLPLTWSGARIGQRLQRGNARRWAAGLIIAAGTVTIMAPWLMQVPALHGPLAFLGCAPLR